MMTVVAAGSPLQVSQLAAVASVAHGFFAAVNMHPGLGSPSRSRAARRAARQRLGLQRATSVVLNQVHGCQVVALARAPRRRPDADGAVTASARLALTVLSADCLPILAAAGDGRLVGAVHAGWRGLRAGVVGTLLGQLAAAGVVAADVRVALGPAIGPCCFEVGVDVARALLAQTPAAARDRVAIASGGRWWVDLAAMAGAQLAAGGVPTAQIGQAAVCTACQPGYFSYRRDGALAGCQGSVIAIRS